MTPIINSIDILNLCRKESPNGDSRHKFRTPMVTDHEYTEKIIPDPMNQTTTYAIIDKTAHTTETWVNTHPDDNDWTPGVKQDYYPGTEWHREHAIQMNVG